MALEPRFYTVNEVAILLATTPNHVHAMLKRQELPGIKIGNRGQWRIERSEFERYVTTRYRETAEELAEEAAREAAANGAQSDKAQSDVAR